jgi:hypothetical protein
MATQDIIISNINSVLPELNNNSQVSIWRKIAQAIGYVIDLTIIEFQNTINIINTNIQNYKLGKPQYYIDNALSFQYGDNLEINPDTYEYYYSVIDTTKQIVKKAAFELGVGNQLLLKYAGVDSNGKPVAITDPQKSSFEAYFLNFEIAGLPVTKTTNNPNSFEFTANITYYPNYNLTTLQTEVKAAFENFRDSFGFNGILYIDQLQDYIKSTVVGVKSCYIENTLMDSNSFSWKTSLTSGYFDYVANFESNITYYV